MEELDLYVNYFVEKVDVLRCFRFLHPYQENHTVCFSTKDPERLASLNLSLPTLKEELKKLVLRWIFYVNWLKMMKI